MSSYMERRLLDLHLKTRKERLCEKLFRSCIGYLVALAIPLLHLGLFYNFWARDKPQVNEQSCTCSCFDTIFRGKYEWPPSTYKHIYFNTTSTSFFIFALWVLGVLLCYETVSHVVTLVRSRSCRPIFLLLLLLSTYPHYYGLWNIFQYLNESFYDQWKHQLLFSITELFSSAVLLNLCNHGNHVTSWKLLVLWSVAVVHVVVACTDQLIRNLILQQGQDFEVLRDVALTLPDLIQAAVASRLLMTSSLQREEVLFTLLSSVLLTALAKAL